MNLTINEKISVSDITPKDKPAFIEHLKVKQIYDQTLAIPYPYTQSDADWWVNHVAEETQNQGRSVNWAIRRRDGYLIGGIGYHNLEVGKSHRAEIGYWLAEPYWGKGIMTEVVKKVSHFGFAELGLIRITANVFDFNAGSAKVLEKSGFRLEGILRSHYKKDAKIFDGRLYAKLATD
jgi:RimJ/RimL family protein N-acetyltransferase